MTRCPRRLTVKSLLAGPIRSNSTGVQFAHGCLYAAAKRLSTRRPLAGVQRMATLYEQERDARIRSNNAVMEKLGINALVPPALRAQKARLKSAQRKRRTTTSRAEDVDVAGRRRSSRLAQQAAVVYTTFDNDDDLGDHRPSKARAVAPAKRRPAVHPVPEDGEVRLVLQPRSVCTTEATHHFASHNRRHFQTRQVVLTTTTSRCQSREALWACRRTCQACRSNG